MYGMREQKSQFGKEMFMSVNICKYFSPPLTHPECKYLETCQILKREKICDGLNDKISKKIKWFKSH